MGNLVPLLVAFVLYGNLAVADVDLRVGVLSYRGSAAARTDFQHTVDHLRTALPERTLEVVPLTLEELDAAARAGRVDFIFTNPGNSYQMVRRHGASRLATARYPALNDQQRVIGALIFTRADGPISALGDLIGRRLGVVDEAAFGGHLLARKRLVDELGGAVRRVETVELGFPQQQVLESVRHGKVDAGVVRACLLETLRAEGAVKPGEFRVLGPLADSPLPCATSTALHPGWALLMLPHVPPTLATDVLRALLLQPMAGASNPLAADGWLVPVSYASVEEVYRKLELYPFEQDLGAVLRTWLRDNVIWVAVAAVLLGAFLLHVARVEYLVVRRTRELEREATERRALETEMAHTDRLSSMAMLAGSLAHDLNQPLAAIAAFANGLRQRRRAGTDDPEATERVLERIVEQANRAADFIRSMRNFLSGGVPVDRPLDLRDVLDDAVLLTSGHARHAGLDLVWHRPAQPARLSGDPVRLRQVAVALIQNAIDASQPGQSVSITLNMREDRHRLAVTDSGVGLDDETHARVTEPFFTTKGEKGLGLGLSTALTIVEDHGGKLWLEPRAEAGIVAHVELPAQQQGPSS